MSDYVMFHSDRLAAYDWDGKEKKNVERLFDLSDLRVHVRVDEGVTLGQIFAIMTKCRLLKFFVSRYSWCREIDQFHAQALLPREDLSEGIVKLVVCAHGDMFDKHFNIFTDFYGVNDQGETWGLSLTPMFQLAHLPVVIDERFVVRQNIQDVIFTGERSFTLLEFLDAIYWDISFYGSPEENHAFSEGLKATIQELTEQVGKDDVIPFEEAMRSLVEEE